MEQARHLSVLAGGFQPFRHCKPTRADVTGILRRLGCIQLDTINVATRSHYIIPWSRLGEYGMDDIDATVHPDINAFEYWAHAAAIVDINLLPCFLSRMEWYRQAIDSGDHGWAAENQGMIRHVFESIENHGPITSGFFQRPDGRKRADPWEWFGGKPTTRAIDSLWRAGDVLVQKRVNFRRYYDIAERVVPDLAHMERPGPLEERVILAKRAVEATGVMQPAWLNDYFRTRWGIRGDHGPDPKQILDILEEREEVRHVNIEGLGDAYVASTNMHLLYQILDGKQAELTTLLSPFDNLIWDRQRASELFNFDYRIECYTPAARRIYGYYTMPILHNGDLIGRVDPKADRAEGVLRIRNLHLEAGVEPDAQLAESLQTVLKSFARFTGTEWVSLEKMERSMESIIPHEFSAMR